MNRKITISLTFLSLALTSSFAHAQVLSYDAFRSVYFDQTSNAAPTSSQNYRFYSRIFLSHQTDATSGTLTAPDNTQYAMPQYLLDPLLNTYFLFYDGGTFTTAAAELATYGTGTYHFALNGGTYAGSSADLSMPAEDFPSTLPFLTGTSFSRLQGMDAHQSIALTWNPFTDTIGNNSFNTSYFNIYDVTSGAFVFSNYGSGASYLGETIGANTLASGHQFTYTLTFSSRYDGAPNASGNGFNGSSGLAAFDYSTTGSFSTAVPEPSVLALAGFGLLAVRRKKKN